MRPEMCAMISWPFSSFTRNMVFGRDSEIVPSNSMTSSFAMRPGLLREVGQGRPTSRVFCHVAGLGATFPLNGIRRAPSRERGWQYVLLPVGTVQLKKKNIDRSHNI